MSMPTASHTTNRSSKRKSTVDGFEEPIRKKPKKPLAYVKECLTCHARKVKCSGGKPCTSCLKAQTALTCEFPERDQNVTVKQSYIETLLAENERLRTGVSGIDDHKEQPDEEEPPSEHDSAQRNPLLGDGSWFVPLNANGLPIHISEAADAAFATRFRQALSDAQDIAHIPRTRYITDGKLASLCLVDCRLPTEARARLLVKVSISSIGKRYHFVREDDVLKSLKQYYQDQSTSNPLVVCKLWVLLALGEAYSSRSHTQVKDDFPGLTYFARANRSLVHIDERPQNDLVEVLLLLALYSLFINRRHNALCHAASAIRICLVMGLHMDIPRSQLSDRKKRTDLKRLWWSAYTFERMITSSIGHPASIQDEDIEVDLLHAKDTEGWEATDSTDVEYLNANVLLARIFRDVIATVYSRRPMRDTFSQRVQKALRDLRAWVEQLPEQLQLDTIGEIRATAKHIRSLHTTFNQCVILATRPILLHIFRAHKEKWILPGSAVKKDISETALALAEACIRCARHSIRLLTESWIDGSLTIFDHFDTHHLFSATTILGISSISIGRVDDADREMYETGREFLAQLKINGDFVADECCIQLERMEFYMRAFRASVNGSFGGEVAGAAEKQYQHFAQDTTWLPNVVPTMTAGMALAEPSMQDFLAQADLDLGFLDAQIEYSQLQNLYWPEAAENR